MAAVATEIDQGVGIATLRRAERHNAFDESLIADLTAALRELGQSAEARVVVLSAAGKSFCAGADLGWMRRAAAFGEAENLADARKLAQLLRTLNELPKPTIARVQGPAYGGGVGLIAACDIAIATYDAVFALSEAKLGLIPAVISPYVVEAIGARRARRYFLTAERFSAAEAYRIGLLHEIVPGVEELDQAVGELIDALLACSPAAQAESKQLLRDLAGRAIDPDLIDHTARLITRVRASAEGREGLSAFLDKRSPAWLPPGL
ncbi:MAG: enoyl-CoA hydratase/isomerase family protein [Rhodocyclaceae bacterium]|nr:enoyl-CoA hydratase/isomerase family protein [Rhodocyclaceae bacterium]